MNKLPESGEGATKHRYEWMNKLPELGGKQVWTWLRIYSFIQKWTESLNMTENMFSVQVSKCTSEKF